MPVIALAALPAVLAVAVIHQFGMTVPVADQWDLAPVLIEARQGGLEAGDLWAQHNEHRILFPRLLMLALALPTGWDIRYELGASFVLAALTWGLLALIVKRTPAVPRWSAVPLALVVFSPAQAENWTWGWQVQMFLSNTGAVGSVFFLTQWPGRWRGVAAAAAAAIVAAFSFSSGLTAWLGAGAMLLMDRAWGKRHAAVWFGACAVCVGLYLAGYEQPARHPSAWLFLERPVEFVRFVLIYLGAPLAFGNAGVAEVAGALVAAALAVTGAVLAWRRAEEFQEMLPWLALALYGLAAGLVTAAGRMGFGGGYALQSRYVSLSMFVLMAVLVIASPALRAAFAHAWTRRLIAGTMGAFIVAGYVMSAAHGMKLMSLRKQLSERGALCLENVEAATDECLAVLAHPVERVRRFAAALRGAGMLVPRVDWKDKAAGQGGVIVVEQVDGRMLLPEGGILGVDRREGVLTVRGYAVDDRAGTAGGDVYLVFHAPEGRVLVPAFRTVRPEVAAHFSLTGRRGAGWRAEVRTTALPAPCYRVEVRLLDAETYFSRLWERPICFSESDPAS